MTDSWRLKLRRAHEHLEEATARVEAIAQPGRRALAVRAERRADKLWYYSLDLGIPADEMLPIVIGDFLFNLRSALDHIACANGNSRSQYPIYIEDIWRQGVSRTEAQRLKSERDKWDRWTQGMRADVLKVIKDTQPFQSARNNQADPRHDVLAMLNVLNNADKHRELTIVNQGAGGPVSSFEGSEPFDFGVHGGEGMLPDGAVFLVHDERVDVQFIGEPQVAIRYAPGDKDRHALPLPVTLRDFYEEIAAALDLIERAM